MGELDDNNNLKKQWFNIDSLGSEQNAVLSFVSLDPIWSDISALYDEPNRIGSNKIPLLDLFESDPSRIYFDRANFGI